MPTVSAIIPTYNRLTFIAEAVDSALACQCPPGFDLEVVVVDDASKDGTPDFVEHRYASEIRSGRVRVERLTQNRGRSGARNRGCQVARGEFLGFCDDDDRWVANRLVLQLPHFEDPDVQLVHGLVDQIDEHGRLLTFETRKEQHEYLRAIRNGFEYAEITKTWSRITTPVVVIRRSAFERLGGFDESFNHFEDWDLCWRVALTGKIATVAASVVEKRSHLAGGSRLGWQDFAPTWKRLCEKHLALASEQLSGTERNKALGSLYTNLALGEYWGGQVGQTRKNLAKAMLHGRGLPRGRFNVWGAPAVRSVLPEKLALRLAHTAGADTYVDQRDHAGRIETVQRAVTLMFDDGPTDRTVELVDALSAHGHKAVLFVLGCNIPGREMVLVEAIRKGFALGNHSYLHPYFSRIGLAEIREEIVKTEAIINALYEQAGVERPGRWFRFPYNDRGGKNAEAVDELLGELGFDVPESLIRRLPPRQLSNRHAWPTTIDMNDWKQRSEQWFLWKLLFARDGDLVGLHDKPETIPRYLRALCDGLLRMDLKGVLPAPAAPHPPVSAARKSSREAMHR